MLEYLKSVFSIIIELFDNGQVVKELAAKKLVSPTPSPVTPLANPNIVENKKQNDPLPAPPKYFKDVVARYGTPYNVSTQQQDEAIKTQWEHDWMELWKSDKFTKKTGTTWPTTAPFKRMYVNKDLVPYLDKVFETLIEKDLFKELKTYDGCWNIRPIRGTTDKWSMHTFGIAIDINASENPLGGPVNFSPEFLQCWRDSGWTCGADFKRLDGMHFQIVTNA
jgi:hypothetical protein